MTTSPGRSALFLSADLVGSTRYKQNEDDWQMIFLSFYRQFPQMIHEAARLLVPEESMAPSFTLWKAIGDELIFELDVFHEDDVCLGVRIWLEALTRCENQILKDKGLALKGGAFIATFPGPDSESSIPRDPTSEDSTKGVVALNDQALSGRRALTRYQFDYFGPSIDTGFRVAGHATARWFPMSIEVAWAVALSAHGNQMHSANNELRHVDDVVYRGNVELKGVWGGREYPLFAIDRELGDPVHAKLAELSHPAPDVTKIIDVCHACSTDSRWPCRLYLPKSSHPLISREPEDAMAALRAKEQDSRGYEDPASAGEQGGDEPLADDAPLGEVVAS